MGRPRCGVLQLNRAPAIVLTRPWLPFPAAITDTHSVVAAASVPRSLGLSIISDAEVAGGFAGFGSSACCVDLVLSCVVSRLDFDI